MTSASAALQAILAIVYFNKVCKRHGVDFRFELPHRRFNRKIGMYAEGRFDTQGDPISEAVWTGRVGEWLPSEEDRDYVKSLMAPCHEPGKIAGWIAPPAKGVDGKTMEFEYVRL